MTASVRLLAGLAVLFVAGCAAAAPFLPTYSWRYKLTVEVETPEGIKTGSAVREVSVKDTSLIIGPGPNYSVDYRGEAVVVDLGERGTLFVLGRRNNKVDYFYRIVFEMFPGHSGFTPDGMRYYSKRKGKREVPFERAPTMVSFTDPTDPTSVQLVFDSEYYNAPTLEKSRHQVTDDNFAKIFGEGVKLKRVMIEMTDGRVTKSDVKGRLPYGKSDSSYQSWFRKLNYGDPRRVGPTDFY